MSHSIIQKDVPFGEERIEKERETEREEREREANHETLKNREQTEG